MKGQAFSTFKILISAVFALIFLGIIYSVASGYTSPLSSADVIKDALKQANNAPNLCFPRTGVDFSEGDELSSASFAGKPVCFVPSGHFPADKCWAPCCGTVAAKDKISTAISVTCNDADCHVYMGSSNCG